MILESKKNARIGQLREELPKRGTKNLILNGE